MKKITVSYEMTLLHGAIDVMSVKIEEVRP